MVAPRRVPMVAVTVDIPVELYYCRKNAVRFFSSTEGADASAV